jgi:hypothetical protein
MDKVHFTRTTITNIQRNMSGQTKFLMGFHLTISNDSFSSTCGQELYIKLTLYWYKLVATINLNFL